MSLVFLVPEILAICFHGLSLLLGCYVVWKNEDIFTRKTKPKKKFHTVDKIEITYFVVILSLIMNLWFLFNQVDWMFGGYSSSLKTNVYLQWMWYHVGTGVSVCLLHITVHWLLEKIKKEHKSEGF